MNYKKKSNKNLLYLYKYVSFVAGWLFLLTSCASDSNSNYRPPMSGAIGKTSEIVVVADDNVWEGMAGDSMRYYFESAYLLLPQPEPMFDLRHLTPEQLKNDRMLRDLRTFVFLGNFQDEHSETNKIIQKDLGPEKIERAKTDTKFHTVVGHNKWARGQLVTFIFGNSQQALSENIKSSFPKIAKRIHDFDQSQIGNYVYFKGRNIAIEKTIKEKMGAEMNIPQEYFVAINEENTIWLRKESTKLSANIFIHKLPYTSQSQFTQEGIRSIRDSLGKKYVTTEVTGAYMRTNDVDLPMFAIPMELHGNYAVEVRGVWDLVNDFMGGPFIGYLIHDKADNQLLYIEGFIHAPSTTKRKFMERIEHILRNTKFGNSSTTTTNSEK
ncbi:MAG: DUF4837 family protein [Saprospiraceae bacterium]|nr:DUF4837 family protein [Saprospiraceae bacterium]MDG2417846.1 DUF4837 family protein [Saprospiraceae bacterium]